MLWFNDQAEEAVTLYTNLFENSKITNTTNRPDGGVFTVEFELMGAKYTALYVLLEEAFFFKGLELVGDGGWGATGDY